MISMTKLNFVLHLALSAKNCTILSLSRLILLLLLFLILLLLLLLLLLIILLIILLLLLLLLLYSAGAALHQFPHATTYFMLQQDNVEVHLRP